MTDPNLSDGRRGEIARPFAGLALGLLVAAATVACDTDRTPKAPKLTRPGPEYAVPAVQDPLDLARFSQRPCTIFTAEQAEQLHLPDAAEPDLAECVWRDSNADLFYIKLRATVGLSKVYTTDTETHVKDGSIEGSWEPTTLAGYPAAHTRPDSPRICAIEVGVSDTQSFRIDDGGAGNRAAAVRAEDRQDPCARTRVAAALIMQNLRDQAH